MYYHTGIMSCDRVRLQERIDFLEKNISNAVAEGMNSLKLQEQIHRDEYEADILRSVDMHFSPGIHLRLFTFYRKSLFL